MTLTEAVNILWRTNAHLIRWDDRQDASRFFGAFTACARTTSRAYGLDAFDAAIVWVRAKTGDTYKESLRLFDEINGTEEAD